MVDVMGSLSQPAALRRHSARVVSAPSSVCLAGVRLQPTRVVPWLVRRSATRAAPRASSYPDDQIVGHRLGSPQVPARELSEEEKQKRVEGEADRIRKQTELRSQRLKNETHTAHLNHELKFGKMMLSQGSIESALVHFNNVVGGSSPDSYHRGEATLQKAACLEKLGREQEAKDLYQSLIRFRAPYPDIKRRAEQALFGESADESKAPRYDDYMYKMFLSGFGSYMPKKKYVETKEEKAVMTFLPWAMLLMAPLMLVGLLFFPQQ